MLLKISNLTIRLAGNTVIDQLSLAVYENSNWAIIGSSGSGKSVLLQAMAGNIVASSGSLTYNFKDRQGNPVTDHQSVIAIAGGRHHFKNLSNTGNFYYQQRYNSSDSGDALTTEQYLTGIKASPHSPVTWTFEKTLEALQLRHLRDKEVIKLSNGETKRLMLAAALLKNPKLLLLDNPLTGLDVATRRYFNTLINEISASGIAVVMITQAHELPDAITDVAILQDGRMIKSMSRQQLEAGLKETSHAPVINAEALGVLNARGGNTADYQKIVCMNNVCVRYGDKIILDQINWKIGPGDRWALLGPNGAGKSTLLSLINGDNPQAYANDITLFDKRRGTGESIWDIKGKIGFVSPELYQYFPGDISCLQAIESGFYDTLGLFRPGNKTRAELALTWMKALGIEKYARLLLKNIPASTQRLCLLARALIKNPALLIFDEPCQGLDEQQQRHFKAVVDTICSSSKVTLIYVTHYQYEIPDSVDKVLRLDKGKVLV